MGKLEWVQNIVHECKLITKYIYNHAWVLNLMREFKEGKLSRPTVTHFATNFRSLQSFLNEYQALREMFCSQQLVFCKDSTKPDAFAIKVSLFKNNLWEKVTMVINMTKPLVKGLRIIDGEKPPMGYIYEGMDMAKEAIKTFYRGIHLNISLYGKLLIPSGRGSYIHCCMQREHISIHAYSIMRGLTFKKIQQETGVVNGSRHTRPNQYATRYVQGIIWHVWI
jgi:hypothetical protein